MFSSRMFRYAAAVVLCVLPVASWAAAADAPAKSEAELPRVLIIGDSISMGYTPFVKEMMKGKAYVEHPKDNCAATVVGLEKLSVWLGDKKWDVIHFNWGLHDLKYIKDTKGTAVDKAKGKQWVPVDQYEKNLDELVGRLEKTGAKLIWANTTPVPEGTGIRDAGEEIKYNEAAARVMTAHHIPTDDLHAIVVAHPELQRPRNVHFSAEGYKELAKSVTEHVEKELAAGATPAK
jgi:hypothetical protein